MFCFEIGSYHVIQPWLAWVSKRFACLSHLGAGTKGVHHHAQFVQFLKPWLCNVVQALWRRTGTFLLTNAGFWCCSFQFSLSFGWAHFSDVFCQDSRGCRSEQHQWLCTLMVQVWLSKCFGTSFQSNHQAGHGKLLTIYFHFMSKSNQEMVSY